MESQGAARARGGEWAAPPAGGMPPQVMSSKLWENVPSCGKTLKVYSGETWISKRMFSSVHVCAGVCREECTVTLVLPGKCS